MLRVMLVDDEPYIREGLAELVDWEAEGFYIAAEASNGAQAVEKLRQSQFDLILSDVKMPIMNGIELLKTVREEHLSDARFVILSGFTDFKYAKTAIQYNCTDYIEKPICRDDLLKLLRTVAKEYEHDRRAELDKKHMERMLLERHLSAIIRGKFDEVNLDYVRSRLRTDAPMRYISVELDARKLGELNDMECRSMQRRLYERMIASTGDDSGYVVFDVNKSKGVYDVGFLYTQYLADKYEMTDDEYIRRFSEHARSLISGAVRVSTGSEVQSLEELSKSYRAAMVARVVSGFNDSAAGGEQTAGEMMSYTEQKRVMDSLVEAVERGDREQMGKLTDELYDMLFSSDTDHNAITLSINYLMYALIHMGVARNPNINQQEIMEYMVSQSFGSEIVRGSKAHFLSLCEQYSDYIKQLSDVPVSGILAKVEQEIAESYMQNISLKSLSEKYFINSAYLGQLFRKKFKCTFKEYLNTYRVNKAAELLLRTDMRVYEISEAVGYQSMDYFISKFVAQKGHTPTQYRKRSEKTGINN